jgi:hypothetical protein
MVFVRLDLVVFGKDLLVCQVYICNYSLFVCKEEKEEIFVGQH